MSEYDPSHLDWCYERLVSAVSVSALSPDEQLARYPDFVAKADEIAEDFSEAASHVPMLVDDGRISEDTHALVRALDDLYGEMSKDRSLWSEDSVHARPEWQHSRRLASDVLRSMGEALRRGDLLAPAGVYVRGGRSKNRDRSDIKLWTIQSEPWFDQLQRDGDLRASKRDSNFEEEWGQSSEAFEWMVEQLRERTGVHANELPVWAWWRYGPWWRRRPNLRADDLRPKGEQCVMLTLRVPKELVLLSDFNMWHHPLNGWGYVADDPEDGAWFESLDVTDEEREKIARASWTRMFDLEFGSTEFWGPRRKRRIQACVPYVMAEWVVGVRRFTAR